MLVLEALDYGLCKGLNHHEGSPREIPSVWRKNVFVEKLSHGGEL